MNNKMLKKAIEATINHNMPIFSLVEFCFTPITPKYVASKRNMAPNINGPK